MTVHERIQEALKDQEGMLRAMSIGLNQALMRHKRLGESISVWDDLTNSPKMIPPEEIPELDTEWPADLYYAPRDNPNYKK